MKRIYIPELAAAAYLSDRKCFRVFRDCLRMTPAEYLKNYRLQMACQMLANGGRTCYTNLSCVRSEKQLLLWKGFSGIYWEYAFRLSAQMAE